MNIEKNIKKTKAAETFVTAAVYNNKTLILKAEHTKISGMMLTGSTLLKASLWWAIYTKNWIGGKMHSDQSSVNANIILHIVIL